MLTGIPRLVALLTCGIAPVLFSLLRFLPLPRSWVRLAVTTFVIPFPVLPKRCVEGKG
jgi:hypothetical protein